ncbi:MAG TPA: hypothetical protein VHP12_02465 [Chitinophagaceae bacterium]|nr:hypothetical protein [Chitinophagaceae bacterium]
MAINYANNHIENRASAGSVLTKSGLKKCKAYFFKEAGADRVFNVMAPGLEGKYFYSFLLVQKRNKKRPPKMITPQFRVGALIWLLYYCDFGYRAVML